MKTERRHELERNQLANSLGHWADSVRPYVNTILAGILVLVVVAAIYTVAHRRTAAGSAKAWDEYFTALGRLDRLKLEDVGENNAGTPVGWWSLCMAAELGLDEGSNQLFRDKLLAQDILRCAADRYQQVLGEAPADVALLKQARFGLARVHECLGEIKKAEDEYQAIANKWPDTPVALAAEKRAKDLKGMEARQFYDWFAKQDIGKGKVAPRPGMPGMKLPYDLDVLPDSPDQPDTSLGDDALPGSSPNGDAPADTTSEPGTTSEPAATSETTGGATSNAPAPQESAPAGKGDAGKTDAGRKE